jgi:hypothetical protein
LRLTVVFAARKLLADKASVRAPPSHLPEQDAPAAWTSGRAQFHTRKEIALAVKENGTDAHHFGQSLSASLARYI